MRELLAAASSSELSEWLVYFALEEHEKDVAKQREQIRKMKDLTSG